jgi:hypothetical protein
MSHPYKKKIDIWNFINIIKFISNTHITMENKRLPPIRIFRELIISRSDYLKLAEKISGFITCAWMNNNCDDVRLRIKFHLIQNEMYEWELAKTGCYNDEQYSILKNLYGTS